MGKKPIHEELRQRISDLEREAAKRDEEERDAYERYCALFDRSLFAVYVHDLCKHVIEPTFHASC